MCINIDEIGIDQPLSRNEQYISVSASGYSGKLSCNIHDELKFLGKVYSEKLNVAEMLEGGFLKWKLGYKNSITFIDGFGPNDMGFYNSFGQDLKNVRKGMNIAAVIDRKYIQEIVEPSSDIKIDGVPFEYYSLALHPFLKEIKLEMIIGWIVDKENVSGILADMKSNKIRKKPLWLVEELSEV